MSIWVSNTSPLIFLSKIDRLDLLRRAAPQIRVPPLVFQEIQHQNDEAATRVTAAVDDWLSVESPDEKTYQLIRAGIGPGEAAALALAIQCQAEKIVLDDLDARRFARRLGLQVIGTAGLLLAARLRGEIENLGKEIGRLRDAGFFISSELLRRILQEAGE